MALPSPTVLGLAQGYIPTGKSRYLFIPTVADLTAPSSAEITAGSDLSKLVAAVDGFNGSGATLDFPNAFSRVVPKVAGLITLADSSFTLNRDGGGTDASDLFSDGADGTDATTGVVGIADTGLGAEGTLKLFRVTVLSITPSRDIAAVRTDQVMFSISEMGPSVAVPSV